MDNEELQAMNVPAYKRHQAAQAIARQFGFDPSDESFAKCVGAILEAWRVDSSLGDRSGAARWIPVSERLPEDSVARLVWCPGRKNRFAANYKEGKWTIFGAGYRDITEEVTHWMPLPNAPVEELSRTVTPGSGA